MFCRVFLLLCCLIFVASDAMAQAPSVSQSRGGWVVSPVKNTLCSMKNNFNNNMDLVFAQNAAGVWSMAIDARENVFKKNKRYDVRLNIPSVVDRWVEAAATGPHVIIIQMGHDFEFFDAVRRHSMLEISMTGLSASFALRGTSKALDKMDECVGRLVLKKAKKKPYTPKRNQIAVEEVERVVPRLQEKKSFIQVTTREEVDRQKEAEDLKNQKAEEAEIDFESEVKAETEFEAGVKAKAEAAKAKVEAEVKAEAFRVLAQKQLNVGFETKEVQNKGTVIRPLKKPSTEPVLKSVSNHKPDVIQILLERAGINQNTVVHFKKVKSLGDDAYQWQKSQIFSSAHQVYWSKIRGLRSMALAHIEQMKGKCAGSVSYTMGGVERAVLADVNIEFLDADVVCIDGQQKLMAAVLFYNQGNKFVIFSSEGAFDQRANILAMRDDIWKKIRP